MQLPHDATPKQKRYIALLCMKLGDRRPEEEIPTSQGDAGRIIRELKARLRIQILQLP